MLREVCLDTVDQPCKDETGFTTEADCVKRAEEPGTRRATIGHVAALAGVSAPTVSRVLTGSANVAPQTRSKVEAAIDQLDYRPSAIAQALSYGKTMSIAAVVPFLTHPSAVHLIRGLIDGLRASRLPLTLYDIEEPHHRVEHVEVLTSSHPPVGMLFALNPTPAEIVAFKAAGSPVVFVDADVPAFSSVSVDHRAAGRLATQHLLDLGHERIGFVGDLERQSSGFVSSALHRRGYRDALESARIRPDRSLEQAGHHGQDYARTLALGLLKDVEPPTGIVAASDTQAMGVMDAARELGIDVPGELSIIGFDDIRMSAFVGLTTVRQPLEESGRIAAEILIAAIETPGSPPIHERLPVDLITRETTGEPRRKRRKARERRETR